MTINLLKYLLLPPLLNVLLFLLGGLLLYWQRRVLGYFLILLAVFSLLVLSLPMVSYSLQRSLEHYPALAMDDLAGAGAIVILGGGREHHAPEFPWQDAPSEPTLRRLVYGAYLARQSGLPILLTGGRLHREPLSEAEVMDKTLQASFGLQARWLEQNSRTTFENAVYSAELLHQLGVKQIVLVSQGWHLARAVPVFEVHGMTVIPAPTGFATMPPQGLMSWIPRVHHLAKSTQALHEWMGSVVYRFYSVPA